MQASNTEKLKVLIVDDNEMSRRLVALPLEQDGHSVLFATGGAEALASLAQDVPDLVFLDLLMDDMNGEEILRHIESDASLSDVPVIVVSGIEDPDAATRCLSAGAVDFVYKPAPANRIREIATRVSVSLSDKWGLIDFKGTVVLDPAAIEQLQADYDDTVTIGFIRRFQSAASEHLQGIRAAAVGDHLDTVKLHTIDLRGGARTLGMHRLATVCHNLESCCKPGHENDMNLQVEELSARLNEALSALADFVRARRIED